MFTIKTSKKNTIVYANHFVVGTGYKRMRILAEAHGGNVDTDKKSKLAKITFGDTTSANEFAKQFTQEYKQAHKAYTPKPKASKGNTAPSTKEMTAEEEYNFCYDLAKANGTLGDLKVAMQLGELAKRVQAERKTTSSSKKTTKGKGNKKVSLNDFVVNNPSCTRDEAKAYGFKGTRAELKALKVELGVR